MRASNEGNLKLVKVILDLGADLNAQTKVPSYEYIKTNKLREREKRKCIYCTAEEVAEKC